MTELKPRFDDHPQTLLAGLAGRYTAQTKSQIPELWRGFAPYLGKIPGQVGWTTYGVCSGYRRDGSFEYLCGVEVSGLEPQPSELKTLVIPPKMYAVFSHTGHISGIANTWSAIFSQWLPTSGCTLDQEPNFEVYTDQFDPQSGTGLVEIWIALKAGIVV